jgi:hypothetical protein
MRFAWTMVALAGCFVSGPATAKTEMVPRKDAVVTLLPPSIALGTVRATRDFRFRTGLGAASPLSPDDLMNRVHTRFVTAMVDFYPIEGKGFHLSAGTRFFARRNFTEEAENATRYLIYVPRGGGGGLRGGFKRFTPAATVGYTGDLAEGMSLGLEAGARLGRAFTGMPRLRRMASDSNTEGARGDGSKPNPMVNMVFGLRF